MTDPNNENDQVPAVENVADDLFEDIRELARMTRATLPAPTVYRVLGNVKHLGHGFPQALRQMGRGLERSLTEYKVYEDDGSDPAINVAVAKQHMDRAAALAAELGRELEKAQSAINGQGHHE